LVSEGIGKYEVWNQGVGHRLSVLEKGCLIKPPPACLTAELLAVILQTVTKGRTSLDIARDMLSRYGGLVGLLAADRTSLTENPGIGAAKAARFVAMKELSQRHMLEAYSRRIS
jgi:DNA repair protein RadC